MCARTAIGESKIAEKCGEEFQNVSGMKCDGRINIEIAYCDD